MTADLRKAHPYHMHEAILAQPDLAVARGTNPDSFRVDDSRFARADVSGRL